MEEKQYEIFFSTDLPQQILYDFFELFLLPGVSNPNSKFSLPPDSNIPADNVYLKIRSKFRKDSQ